MWSLLLVLLDDLVYVVWLDIAVDLVADHHGDGEATGRINITGGTLSTRKTVQIRSGGTFRVAGSDAEEITIGSGAGSSVQWKQAEGGTLLLDEIGDLPPALQPKLLRFVQEKKYERVGDPDTRTADVRILAATNQDLGAAVDEGRFREDLFYRLRVVEVTLPPLRKRPEDILPLADRFLARFTEDYNRALEKFTDEARRALQEYRWPGNVRELKNAVERAVILSQGAHISASNLPFSATGPPRDEGKSSVAVGQPISLKTLEKEHIRRVVSRTDTLEAAADVLGIDPATLYRKRRKYDMV